MGVAFTSCTVPAAGRPTFDIGPDEIEIGVGIHGEPGRRRGSPHAGRRDRATLLDAILGDLQAAGGPASAAARQRLRRHAADGAVPAATTRPAERLKAEGLAPVRSLVGNYTTSLEMAGASLTVTLLDDELMTLWDAPVHTAALRW